MHNKLRRDLSKTIDALSQHDPIQPLLRRALTALGGPVADPIIPVKEVLVQQGDTLIPLVEVPAFTPAEVGVDFEQAVQGDETVTLPNHLTFEDGKPVIR